MYTMDQQERTKSSEGFWGLVAVAVGALLFILWTVASWPVP